MANPWEEYQQTAPAQAGPWTEYDQRKPAPVPADPTWGDRGRELLQGTVAGFDRASLGLKGMLPPAVQEAGDWIDRKTGMRKLTPETAVQAPDTWAGILGSVIGRGAVEAPLMAAGGATIPGQMLAGGLTSMALTPGDLAERAQAGAKGSAGAGIGGVLTRTLGRLFKPIGDKTADVMALEKAGVSPTFGQGMASKGGLGRAVGRLEEAAQSVPLAGVPIRNQRAAAGTQWQAATREAALPVGAPSAEAGSIDRVGKAFSDRYNATLASERLPYASVTYQPDMRRLAQGRPLSAEQRQVVEDAFQGIRMKYLQNPTPGVQPTAAAAHGVESELKDLGRRYTSSQDPAQQDLGALFNKIAGEYGQTWRGALQPQTAKAVAELDRAYPAYTAIREAGKKVATGQSGGVAENYTPSVLLRAGRQLDRTPNKSRYLRGEAAQQELAGQGQRVLGDKLGDSGTAERAMVGMGSVGGAGLGMFTNPLGTLGTAGALAGYGTKPVQDYLMGRLGAGTGQQAMLDALRRAAPYGAMAGAVGAND
jgi:hypothetical protein